ncbi:MAG TPA: hypothetical protein VF186_07540 [Gaiellaceae bacterium]
MSRGAARSIRPFLVFRQLNEQLRLLSEELGHGRLEIVCECDSAQCLARITVPVEMYESARRFPTRFVVRADHVRDGGERCVEERDRVAVVEKVGLDAQLAIRHDPRRSRAQGERSA